MSGPEKTDEIDQADPELPSQRLTPSRKQTYAGEIGPEEISQVQVIGSAQKRGS